MGALASVGPVVWSLLALQGAQALLTAFVFWAFERRFGNPVLRYWTYAWVALAGQLVGLTGCDLLAERGVAVTTPTYAALSAFMVACAYLKVTWLLVGGYALAMRRVAPRAAQRTAVVGALVLTVASCLPYAFTAGAAGPRFVARVGTMGFITGVTTLAAGLALWIRTSRRFLRRDAYWNVGRGIPALGQRIVATTFVTLGALTLASVVQTLRDLPHEDVPPVVPPMTAGQLLLNFALGLGLVIWLLEAEQGRTLEAAQRAEHMAYHDALTGLPNRLLLIDRLRLLVAHARRSRQPFAVFFLDVDHFKSINDTFGHAAGDRLLQQVAARLTAQLREADTVARLGGDEFVVLTPDLRRGAGVTAVGEKLLEAVRAPIVLDEREVRVTVSIGVSVFPDDGDDADALLRRSDAALYRAKEEGRDAVRLA